MKHTRTALVVEEDNTLRVSLARLLEDEGFEVMTAPTYSRAQYVLFDSDHAVDVVLLDLSLLYGGGEQIVERLERCAVSPSVVVTSLDARKSASFAATYGLPFLAKPYDMNIVAATVLAAADHDMRPRLRSVSGSRPRIGALDFDQSTSSTSSSSSMAKRRKSSSSD